jgi:type IV secretory pathway ATPase VirB11/archaellum biosynthesis ATPase
MRAEKLDHKGQFREILKEVKEKGECVIDTGVTLYTLKPHAVRELKRLSNIIEGLDYSVLLPAKTTACTGCTRDRARLLSRVIGLAEEGRFDEARIALSDIPCREEEPCMACVERFKRETAPLAGYHFRLKEIDFTSSPYLTASSKISLEEAEVVETYMAPLCRVRVLQAEGEYYYDPLLPLEEFSPRERSILSMVREEMEKGLSTDTLGVLEVLCGRYDVDSHRLKGILEVYAHKLGDLQYLIADKRLTDIYVSPSGRVRVSSYDYGDMECTLRFTSRELERLASRLRMLSGKPFDHSHPLASFFWEEENCRFSAVGYSGNYSSRPDLAVRLWPEKPWHILDILHRGSISLRLASLLTVAANLGVAVIIGGDRGSGKSTLLQSFLFMIPRQVRKVALLVEREIHSWFFEQEFNISEFKVHTGEKVTSSGVPIEQAVKQLLVHGESGYLIFNEVKFEEEARPFFTLSAVAGMSSLLTTMHAEDARGIVHRLMVDFRLPLAALRNIDWVITTNVVGRGLSREKRRVVTGVVEIGDFFRNPLEEDRLNAIVEYEPLQGTWNEAEPSKLVEASRFLQEAGRKRGMKEEEVASMIALFERVYREIYKGYPLQPERFSFLMEELFRAYEQGDPEKTYRRWWRRCWGVL